MGVAHLDAAPAREYALGHLRGRWTMLGEAAGADTVGVRRIQLPAGGWSTPVHDHGRSEEIFYVLSGTGVSWHNGQTAAIGAGDCILYLPRRGGHTLRADTDLDVLAFGTREFDESLALPRLGLSMAGRRGVESIPPPGDGTPLQHVRESELGPPELPPEPGERPATIVNLGDVAAERTERPRVARVRRNLGRAVGSRRAGLQHVTVDPGRYATPEHCHSLEEEIFVMLSGSGVLVLGGEETPVGPGHVIARPAGTGVAHAFRAETELEFLAYGTRERNDICFYPRSGKIAFWGVDVIARVERIADYWDGED
ncbi:MAG TPA: cupin domain-containing protein [Solirubrobacteraceae bacterium]|nr:cupin domain-containing protein [Solirubrobacteraceae bacterium]